MRFYFIFSLLIFVNTYAQKTEKIIFQSANPFALSDIINNLENQTEQEVFGKLTLPKDSINLDKKISSGYRGGRKFRLERTPL